MIIIKFILLIFLFFMAWLIVTMDERMQPRSGPNYYLDMGPGSVNSIQPQYRISRTEAFNRPHAFEVECFNNGEPFRITVLEKGVRKSSTYYFVDGYGRLRYVGHDDFWGRIRMQQLSPPPKD